MDKSLFGRVSLACPNPSYIRTLQPNLEQYLVRLTIKHIE
jgi:hypothetical protein